MRRGFLLARIRGVDVRADASLIILVVLIVSNLSIFYSHAATLQLFSFEIRSTNPPLEPLPSLLLATLTALLFVASILAHELAHAAAFRSRGIPVRGITLFMFGGYTQGANEAEKPVDELLIAGVGPLTTTVLGLLFLAMHVAAKGADLHALRAMFGYLALLNLFMGVFNLLPGLPLDGGRVLMSILWRVTGQRPKATRYAARAGQIVALLISAAGVLEIVESGQLGGIWLLFIGWMMFSGSTAVAVQSERAGILESATAGDVMSPPPPTVPADMSVAMAMERYLSGREGEAFPVVDDGRVVGFISPTLARLAPLGVPVRDAMAGTEAVAIADPSESMADVADRIRDRHGKVALVVDQGRLVGVIEEEDLARYFRSKKRSQRTGRGPVPAPPRPDQMQGGSQ